MCVCVCVERAGGSLVIVNTKSMQAMKAATCGQFGLYTAFLFFGVWPDSHNFRQDEVGPWQHHNRTTEWANSIFVVLAESNFIVEWQQQNAEALYLGNFDGNDYSFWRCAFTEMMVVLRFIFRTSVKPINFVFGKSLTWNCMTATSINILWNINMQERWRTTFTYTQMQMHRHPITIWFQGPLPVIEPPFLGSFCRLLGKGRWPPCRTDEFIQFWTNGIKFDRILGGGIKVAKFIRSYPAKWPHHTNSDNSTRQHIIQLEQ